MRVADYLKLMNKEKTIKVERVYQLKKYYIGMYRSYLMQLYDKGFINDPTRFDIIQIRVNIVDLGISGLYNTLGELQLNLDFIKFAMCKHKDSEAIMEFLSILYNVVKYRTYSQGIDSFYEEFGFAVNDKQKISPNFRVNATKVVCGMCTPISRGVLECFLSDKKTVGVIDCSDYIWLKACKELGIPDKDWESNGLFIEGMSHICELESVRIILNGEVELTGKYGKVLSDWLFSHKWKVESGIDSDSKGLFDYVFYSDMTGVFSDISSCMDRLVGYGDEVIGLVDNRIYYSKPISCYKIPIGCFMVVSGDGDEVMPDSISMNGVTGEFYTLDYLRDEEVKYVGCPLECVYVDSESGKIDVEYIYDFEQLDVRCSSYFIDEKLDYDFEGTVSYDLSEFDDVLERELYRMYKNSLTGDLVGVLDANKYSLNDIEEAKKRVMLKI